MSARHGAEYTPVAVIEGHATFVHDKLVCVPVVSAFAAPATCVGPTGVTSCWLVPTAVVVCRSGGTEWLRMARSQPASSSYDNPLQGPREDALEAMLDDRPADVAHGPSGPAAPGLARMLEADDARAAAAKATFVSRGGWSAGAQVQLHVARASIVEGALTITTGRRIGALRVEFDSVRLDAMDGA